MAVPTLLQSETWSLKKQDWSAIQITTVTFLRSNEESTHPQQDKKLKYQGQITNVFNFIKNCRL